MHKDLDQPLRCRDCGTAMGEIFICGEGFFCNQCYDKLFDLINE